MTDATLLHHLKNVLDSAADFAIVTADLDLRVTYVNPLAEELFGLSAKQMAGHCLESLHSQSASARDYMQAALQVIQNGGEHTDVIALPTPDGLRVLSMRAAGSYDAGGSLTGYTLFARDVNRARLAEEALRQNEGLLQGIIHQISDGVVGTDEEGRIVEWSREQEAITGLARDEALGRFIWDVQYQLAPQGHQIPEALAENKARILACLLTGSAPWLGRLHEVSICRPNGVERSLQVSTFAFATEQGYRIGSVSRDVSETRQKDDALRRRAEALSALYDLSLDITAPLELPALLEKVVERAMKLLNAGGGSLSLVEPGQRALRVMVERSLAARGLAGTVFQFGEGALGTVAASGQPLIVDDYRAWEGRLPIHENTQPYIGVLSVPLIWQGDVTGVLQVLDNTPERRFSREDQELLSLFAGQAAVAIENARLLGAERSRRREAETLTQATSLTLSTLDLEQVLDSILTHMEQVVPYDSASVFLLKDNRLRIVATRGFHRPESLVEQDFPMDDLLFSQIWNSCQPLILEDAQQDARFQAWLETDYVHGWMGVPLLVREQVIGVITLDSRHPAAYTTESALLAAAFANQAAAAIENARLFEIERNRASLLDAVRKASLALTASLELPEVLDSILQSALQLLSGAGNGHIFLYNPADGGQLSFGAALWSDGKRTRLPYQPRPEGLTYQVARGGEIIAISDIGAHPIYRGAPAEWKGAIIGLPLKIGNRVVGVMNIAFPKERPFSESELCLLGLLGDHAAIAIENARLYENAATKHRHLSLLYDVGRELASSLDPVEIFNWAITLTCRALNGVVGQAFTYLPDGNLLRVAATYGLSDEAVTAINATMLHPGDGLAGWVARYRQAVYLPDLSQDPRWLHVSPSDDNLNSAICAPIFASGKLLGVLSVMHTETAAFSPDHLTLLQAICQEVGLALSNASRYQEVQRRLAEITLIQNLTQIFSQRLEVEELLDEVATQLARKLGFPLVEVWLIEGDTLIEHGHFGHPSNDSQLPLTYGLVGRAARTGQAILIHDVSEDSDYIAAYPNTRGELVVPIYNGKVVVGVINVETDRPNQLTAHDLRLVEVLAGQISIALENAVLYERLRLHAEELGRTVEQRTAELTELYELSQEIGSTLSHAELLKSLLTRLQSALGCDLTVGSLWIDGQRLFFVETACPLAPPALAELRRGWLEALRSHGEDPADFANAPAELSFTQDVNQSAPPLEAVASLLGRPIYISGRPAGVLFAGSRLPEAFGAPQARLMDTFANQASGALQRLSAMLAAEQKRLEGLVEHLPVGMLLLDQQYRLLVANASGRAILAALNGEGHETLITRLGAHPMSTLTDFHRDGLPYEIATNEHPPRYFEVDTRPTGKDDQQWLIMLREVTQERQIQAQVQMQERLATVGQLAAGIAHDFNNIMAAILVYADLLSDDPFLPQNSRERLAIIQQQVQRAASLIRQILDFSRRSVMEQSTLELLPFVKELKKLLGRILPETIQLELSYAPAEYRVIADPARLQQALLNLALNARDAMSEGGILHFEINTIRLAPDDTPPVSDMPAGEWIQIAVSDNGEGIPSENLPHIFEPFFTTKPVGQGTGLGLAQVYGIIQQHGGFIDVHSTLGEGTIFKIYLPPAAQRTQERPSAPTRQNDGVGKTVLVVEDDVATREALNALLEAQNYRVITAVDGRGALIQLQEEQDRVDLVITDVVMPHMGGVALYRAIQKQWPAVKVLFVTGHPLEGDSQELLERGRVHWLQKPFSVQVFNQAVYAMFHTPGD
jgi:PAS domain S-box-containing protein